MQDDDDEDEDEEETDRLVWIGLEGAGMNWKVGVWESWVWTGEATRGMMEE